jgi:hypothetical protein
MRGIFQAAFLAEAEERMSRRGLKFLSPASLLAGSSTGAIVAVAISIGKTPAEICELYHRLGKDVFGKPCCELDRLQRLMTARVKQACGFCAYDYEKLEECFKSIFGHRLFGECHPRTIVTAVDHVSGRGIVFDSRVIPDMKIVTVLMATTAAPFFFRPHLVRGSEYLDGGVVRNNPAYEGVRQARNEVHSHEQLRLFAVGSGRWRAPPQPPWIRSPRWQFALLRATNLIDKMIDGAINFDDGLCRDFFDQWPTHYERIDPVLPCRIPLDDYRRAMEHLPLLACQYAELREAQIADWCR